jgi:hypothetical protein
VTDAELVIRPATTADFPAIEAIYVAAEQPPPGGSPAPAGWMTRYLEHLLDRGEVLVADRESVTFGFAAWSISAEPSTWPTCSWIQAGTGRGSAGGCCGRRLAIDGRG